MAAFILFWLNCVFVNPRNPTLLGHNVAFVIVGGIVNHIDSIDISYAGGFKESLVLTTNTLILFMKT